MKHTDEKGIVLLEMLIALLCTAVLLLSVQSNTRVMAHAHRAVVERISAHAELERLALFFETICEMANARTNVYEIQLAQHSENLRIVLTEPFPLLHFRSRDQFCSEEKLPRDTTLFMAYTASGPQVVRAKPYASRCTWDAECPCHYRITLADSIGPAHTLLPVSIATELQHSDSKTLYWRSLNSKERHVFARDIIEFQPLITRTTAQRILTLGLTHSSGLSRSLSCALGDPNYHVLDSLL